MHRDGLHQWTWLLKRYRLLRRWEPERGRTGAAVEALRLTWNNFVYETRFGAWSG